MCWRQQRYKRINNILTEAATEHQDELHGLYNWEDDRNSTILSLQEDDALHTIVA